MQKAVAIGNDGRGWKGKGSIGITIVSCLLLPLSNDIPVTQSTLLYNATPSGCASAEPASD